MRILQIHKFFYPHAGAEAVFFHTRRLLQQHGHDVVDFAMEDRRNLPSDYTTYFAPHRSYVDTARSVRSRVSDAATSVYSFSARRRLAALLADTRPDVAHMHIIYHQLTMSIVDELARQRVPTVLTLHDYKIGCPAYVLYRDGHPCRLCTSGRVENVALHKCIKGSRSASLIAATEARLARQRHSYDKINIFIAPSSFAGEVAIESGMPMDRIRVIRNFLPDNEVGSPAPSLNPTPRFFFAGRLEPTKGVAEMLDVFSDSGGELGTLVIAGAGGGLEAAVQTAADQHECIEYLGRLPREEVLAQLRMARAALLPSRWDENCPMSVLEARAAGIPVICSARGGLPEMVTHDVDGLVVPVGDLKSFRHAILRLAANIDLARELGAQGHARLLRENTERVHYDALMEAYANAICRSKPHGRRP